MLNAGNNKDLLEGLESVPKSSQSMKIKEHTNSPVEFDKW